MKTRAAVMLGPKEPVVIEELDLDPPKKGEVMVKMSATGVCHSDLSAARGIIAYPEPTVLGHEGAGTVVEVGPGVDSVSVGQRVMLSFISPCGRCYHCSRGRPYICDRHWHDTPRGALFDGTRRFHRNGVRYMHYTRVAAMSEYTVVSEDGVIPVPDEVSLEKAALVGCCVMTGIGAAVNTAQVELGSVVAVLGVGGTGINAIQGARLRGASRVIAIDRSQERLDWSRKFGATETILVDQNDVVDDVLSLTDGKGVDYAFEAIGLPKTIGQAFRMLRNGGAAVVIGIAGPDDQVSLPAQMFPAGERRILGSMYGSAQIKSEMPRLLELYRANQIKLDELVSHTWRLDQIGEAFEQMELGLGLRGVILFD